MTNKFIKSSYTLLLQSKLLQRGTPSSNLKCYSNFKNLEDIDTFKPAVTEYNVSKSENEWKYVERLLPPVTVPEPVARSSYNTNWKPPNAKEVGEHKYFINRNRNYMIPVYMTSSHRGMRKITEIRKIQGDIHKLEKDLKEVIEKSTGKVVASQINEFVGCLSFKGDHVQIVKNFLTTKGF